MKIVTLTLLILLVACTNLQRKPNSVPDELTPKSTTDNLVNLPVNTKFEVTGFQGLDHIPQEFNFGILFGDLYKGYWCRYHAISDATTVQKGEIVTSKRPQFPLTGTREEIIIELKSVTPSNLSAIRCTVPMSIEFFKKQMSPYFKIN